MKTLNKLFSYLMILSSVLMLSCKDNDDMVPDEGEENNVPIGKWSRVSDFDGVPRSGASSFTIGNKGYLLCGYDGKKCLSDVWEYDMERDIWTQKAAFPGTSRHLAVAMAVDGKGYFGTGYDGTDRLNDFWEYDPVANSWTQKADFLGSARHGAVAFGIGNKGYLGCGYDEACLKDFYAFTPLSNSWVQIASIGGLDTIDNIGGSKRKGATSFVINDIAYVCGGINNGNYAEDFWKYDPAAEKWTRLRDISDTSDDSYDDDYDMLGTDKVAFVIGGAAYLTCGGSGSLRLETWKYVPQTDLWESVARFKGTSRTGTVSFSNGGRGFVVSGKNSTNYFDDIWEFDPDEYDDDDY